MRHLTFVVAVALILAACSSSPTPPAGTQAAPTGPAPTAASSQAGPSGTPADPAVVYAAIATQVEQIRDLQPTADVAPAILDQATLTKNLTADFDKSNPASAIKQAQEEQVGLGLLPAGTDLRSAILAFQAGQVLGYYSPDDKKLFVVSRAGGIGPTQRLTYAHEFTHQLQDQHFNLKSLGMDATDQGDRGLARLSLVEGDAVSVQTAWMTTELTKDELAQVLADSLDPAAMAALQNAPPFLAQTSLFPYTAGLAFVQALMANGGYAAVDAAFANPPASTEQILHPEKYAIHEPPIVVNDPRGLAAKLGAGWTEAGQDTLGEEFFRIWLGQMGASQLAFAAAGGWGGDRLVLFEGPGGATQIVVLTAWDTAADAEEFANALTSVGASGKLLLQFDYASGSKNVSFAIGPRSSALLPALPK
jgi:hypothetical protein